MKIDDTFLLWDAAKALTGKATLVRVRRPWNKKTAGRATRSKFFNYIDLAAKPGENPFFLFYFLHECGHLASGHVTKASKIPLQEPSTWLKMIPDPKRENEANIYAQAWMSQAKAVTKRRDWRSMLRALLTIYGE